MNSNQNNPRQLFNEDEVQLWIAVYSAVEAANITNSNKNSLAIESYLHADAAVLHLRERTLELRRERAAKNRSFTRS